MNLNQLQETGVSLDVASRGRARVLPAGPKDRYPPTAAGHNTADRRRPTSPQRRVHRGGRGDQPQQPTGFVSAHCSDLTYGAPLLPAPPSLPCRLCSSWWPGIRFYRIARCRFTEPLRGPVIVSAVRAGRPTADFRRPEKCGLTTAAGVRATRDGHLGYGLVLRRVRRERRDPGHPPGRAEWISLSRCTTEDGVNRAGARFTAVPLHGRDRAALQHRLRRVESRLRGAHLRFQSNASGLCIRRATGLFRRRANPSASLWWGYEWPDLAHHRRRGHRTR